MMNSNLLLSFCLVALLSLGTIHAAPQLTLDVEDFEEVPPNKTDYGHIPVFAWDNEYESHNGSERLIISFPDGGPDDEVILTPTKGLMPNEDGDQSNDCIYSGYFKKESNAYVAVNGCRNSTNISVVIDSDRSVYKMFAVRNGVVTPFNSPKTYRNTTIDQGKHIEDDNENDIVSLSAESRSIQGEGYSLPARFKGTIYVILDKSYRNQFSRSFIVEFKKILNLSNALFKLKSLVTSFDFKVVGYKNNEYNIPITFRGLQYLEAETGKIKDNANVYMVMTRYSGSGNKGYARVGVVCSQKGWRGAITGHTGSEPITAKVFTQNIARILGMKSDIFSTGAPKSCASGSGEMMGYVNRISTKWSFCSIRDFMNYYYDHHSERKPFCVDYEGSVSICMDRSTTVSCQYLSSNGLCSKKPEWAELCRERCRTCTNV